MTKPLVVVTGPAMGAIEGRVRRARVEGGSGGRFEGVVRWSSAAKDNDAQRVSNRDLNVCIAPVTLNVRQSNYPNGILVELLTLYYFEK